MGSEGKYGRSEGGDLQKPQRGNSYDEVAGIINQHQNFNIVVHKNPDGDALGSALALQQTLNLLGKQSRVLCFSQVLAVYQFLPEFSSIIALADEKLLEERSNITVDCACLSQVGVSKDFTPLINLDHHASNTNFANYNLVEPSASATGTIIFKLIKSLAIPLDQGMARCLYVSLSSDTGHFRYSNTNSQDFQLASELLASGFNAYEINYQLYEQMPKTSLLAIGKGLSNLQTLAEGEIVWSTIDDSQEIGSRGLIDYLRELEGSEVAIVFKENQQGYTKVSLRSKRWFDVNNFASSLGGGGHVRASGITIEQNLANTISLVLARIESTYLEAKAKSCLS